MPAGGPPERPDAPVRLLLVDDRDDRAARLRAALGPAVAVAARARRERELAAALGAAADVVLLAHDVPGLAAGRALELVRERAGDVPCIVIADAGPGADVAPAMMRAGAADVVRADDLTRLPAVVAREVRDARERAARRVAEAAYSGLTDRMAGVMRAAGALAVIAADADGVITELNEGAERLLGRPARDLVGRADLAALHDPADLAALAAERGEPSPLGALLARARGGETDTREWRFRLPGGGEVPVATTVAPVIDAMGRVTGFVEIARDISARRRREAEQEALRRVATEVAAGREPEAVLARVAAEAAAQVGAGTAGVVRFEESAAVAMAAWARRGAPAPALGDALTLDGSSAIAAVRASGAAARTDGGGPGDRVLAVPVRAGERLWGALWVGGWEAGPPDAAVPLVERFAELAGIAAANAEERERVLTETVAGIFQGDRDLAETLRLIASAARRALGADRATCYVHREGAEEVAEVHTTETDPERRAALEAAVGLPRERVPIWDLLISSSDPALIVEDVRADGRIPARLAERLGAGAFVGLRLEHPSVRAEGGMDLLGSLFLSFRRRRCFSSRERAAARSMAAMAAVALANARLHAATRRHVAQVQRLASSDPLTGLANHRAFHDRLAHEVARARRHGRSLALALVDIDHFRRINGEYGHAAGDDVLVEVARRLAALARGSDLLARVGGEEIAWVMPETAAMEAWQGVERARDAIARTPFPRVGRVTVSAGVSDLEHADTPGELVRLAEGALYWAKQHGRDVSFLYSPEVVEVLSAEERAERLQRLQSLQSIRVLARAVDAKDPSTREHSERVADLAVAIGEALRWPAELLVRLREAGLVHDVGKIGVPDAILFKPSRLTEREYREIMRHAAIGAEMVADVLDPQQVAWVRGHHERWDGRGYPDGLAGEAIPEGARVLALADAWDVMTSDRPYHAPLSVGDALAECRRCAGGQFWGRAVAAIEELFAVGAARAD